MLRPVFRRHFVALLLLALPACTTLEEEVQPTVDSLHTEQMDDAIRAAQSAKPPEPPPRQPM